MKGVGRDDPLFFMETNSVTDRIKELISPLLGEQGIELVEMAYKREHKRMALRLFVDKAGGITLDECALLNDKIGALLDKDDVIATSYTLEVSSPGLDRPLMTRQDFLRRVGEKMEVFLNSPLNDKVSYFGILREVGDDSISVELKKSESIQIPLNIVNKGKVKIELKKG